MVHNGIEYGLMAAYAEGLNILRHAGAGRGDHTADAETAPLAHPELYQFHQKTLTSRFLPWASGSWLSARSPMATNLTGYRSAAALPIRQPLRFSLRLRPL
jgi:hypothetical protein